MTKHLATLDRIARMSPNLTLDQLGVASTAASRSNAPQRRLRPSTVDTIDLLAEYNGKTFTLEDLEASVELGGVECPVSGDDIARVTFRGV